MGNISIAKNLGSNGYSLQLLATLDQVFKDIEYLKRTNINFIGSIIGYTIKVDKPHLLELKGQLVNRNDYPKLWELVKDVAINDSDWNIRTSGKYSSGDGETTFRLPDYRGVFLRGFDDGRGLSGYSSSTTIGSYHSDTIKAHSHKLAIHKSNFKNSCVRNDECDVTVNNGWQATIEETDKTGWLETAPKHIDIIYYVIAK